MAIIAEVNTPALVAANYHRADLSEVRLVDGKAHVKVLSYRDKQARLAGAEHLARQVLTIDFDMKSTVPAIEQIYAGIKAALGQDARDDIDEVGAYLRENAQATSSALRAAMLASSHAVQQEREVLATPDAHKFPAPHERLTDWDVVGVSDDEALSPEAADAEMDRLIRNQSDGFDVADEISGLSQARRDDLTQAIHRKKGRMRRERMTGAAPQVAEEAALDHLVGLLTRRGV